MLTDQSTSLVADTPGTTTDPVRRNMELPEAGPCVFIDTAGFDDDTELGRQRISLTLKALDEADIALLLVGENMGEEAHWQAILRILPSDFGTRSITGGMAKEGDTVVLVMPQDDSAPKGRLILPQVQTIRELLDLKAIPVCTVPEKLQDTLSTLNSAPSLIITDSQAFANVYPLVPEGTMLTSFSVLMAAHKGDIRFFAESAQTISKLTESSHVLIAEACTHAPQSEDIGRAKIPALLRKRIGQGLRIDHVSGRDFPDNLTGYDLVIHCGGCMFNRQYLLSRVARAKAQGVPMTNYGITIAHLTGALSKVTLPEK